MDAQKIMRNVILGATLVSTMPGAFAHQSKEVQKTIGGLSFYAKALASDGSNCDPAVIEKNLDSLKKADVLDVTNLTLTAVSGHCYGPCPEDVEAGIEKHCAKAEKLAEIVELL